MIRADSLGYLFYSRVVLPLPVIYPAGAAQYIDVFRVSFRSMDLLLGHLQIIGELGISLGSGVSYPRKEVAGSIVSSESSRRMDLQDQAAEGG